MRVGKATVVLALMCCLIHGVAVAQDDSDFEALLNEISSEPVAAAVDPGAMAVDPAAEETDPMAPQSDEPAIPEGMMEIEPAEDASVLEAPVMKELSVVDAMMFEPAEPAEQDTGIDALMSEMEEPAAEEMTLSEPEAGVMDMQEEVIPSDPSEPVGYMAAEVDVPEPADEMVDAAPADEIPIADDEMYVEEMIDEEVAEAPAEEMVDEEIAEAAGAEGEVDLEKAAEMAAKEEVRRQAMEIQGLQSLEEGYKALASGKFADALKQFEEATRICLIVWRTKRRVRAQPGVMRKPSTGSHWATIRRRRISPKLV